MGFHLTYEQENAKALAKVDFMQLAPPFERERVAQSGLSSLQSFRSGNIRRCS
jgi:hypothetical protein